MSHFLVYDGSKICDPYILVWWSALLKPICICYGQRYIFEEYYFTGDQNVAFYWKLTFYENCKTIYDTTNTKFMSHQQILHMFNVNIKHNYNKVIANAKFHAKIAWSITLIEVSTCQYPKLPGELILNIILSDDVQNWHIFKYLVMVSFK